MRPKPGDVLVSTATATGDYDVTIIEGPVDSTRVRYAAAVARARTLATERRVDAWLTEDHIHFLQIACGRDAIV